MSTNSGLSARVAAEVRAEQARQRLSGRDLARRVDLPPSTVARWLRGETSMDLDDVAALAGALGLTLGDLIERAEMLLPRVDSNHQPAGYASLQVRTDITNAGIVLPLRRIDERRSDRRQPTTRRGPDRTLVPILCSTGRKAS
jgi:transcriptional regulator with XRE-family HTH domain